MISLARRRCPASRSSNLRALPRPSPEPHRKPRPPLPSPSLPHHCSSIRRTIRSARATTRPRHWRPAHAQTRLRRASSSACRCRPTRSAARARPPSSPARQRRASRRRHARLLAFPRTCIGFAPRPSQPSQLHAPGPAHAEARRSDASAADFVDRPWAPRRTLQLEPAGASEDRIDRGAPLLRTSARRPTAAGPTGRARRRRTRTA